jgi:hypothetical protein
VLKGPLPSPRHVARFDCTLRDGRQHHIGRPHAKWKSPDVGPFSTGHLHSALVNRLGELRGIGLESDQ